MIISHLEKRMQSDGIPDHKYEKSDTLLDTHVFGFFLKYGGVVAFIEKLSLNMF